MVERVPLEELETKPGDPFADVRHQAAPFTGVGFRETAEQRSEYRFEDGRGHGHCWSTFRSGQKAEEFWLDRGRRVGESWEWFSTGQLKRYHLHEPPRIERVWGPHGRLLEELDEEHELHRSWYASGHLRRESRAGRSRVFTEAGVVAWLAERVEPRPGRRPWDGLTFIVPVVEGELERLAGDEALMDEVFLFVRSRLEVELQPGLSAVARLLAHPDARVRGRAVDLVGERRLDALEAVVRLHLDDDEGAPQSVSTRARRALEALRVAPPAEVE